MLAREAVEIVAATDHLNSQGDTLVDLAVVLAADGSHREAAERLSAGISRYRAKGNVVSATGSWEGPGASGDCMT